MCKGIVIAGTGLGHVNKPLYPALDRELMGLGVIPAANMLPEVAAFISSHWK